MAAPKSRTLSTITRERGRIVVKFREATCIIADSQRTFPGGGHHFPYPTELAQIGTRLARQFQEPWTVKYDDNWRTADGRLFFIKTLMGRVREGEYFDISDTGPWHLNPPVTNDLAVWPDPDRTTQATTTQPPKEATAEMGSIEQIITDIIDRRLATSKPAMDEDAIRNLVADAVAGIKPPRIEIKTGDTIKTLEKHTHPMFGKVLIALQAARSGGKQWPYLVGPAGSGKSTIAEHVAEALGLQHYVIAGRPDLMTHDIMGFRRPIDGVYEDTGVVERMRHGGAVVVDEADGINAGIFIGMNGGIAQGYVDLPNKERLQIHPDFVLIACANTWGTGATAEYVGRNGLDASTRNRFASIPIDYDTTYEQSRAAAVLGEVGGRALMLAICRMRENRDKHKVQVIVGTRNVLGIAHFIAGGIDAAEAFDWSILGGMNPEQKSRLLDGVDLNIKATA